MNIIAPILSNSIDQWKSSPLPYLRSRYAVCCLQRGLWSRLLPRLRRSSTHGRAVSLLGTLRSDDATAAKTSLQWWISVTFVYRYYSSLLRASQPFSGSSREERCVTTNKHFTLIKWSVAKSSSFYSERVKLNNHFLIANWKIVQWLVHSKNHYYCGLKATFR